MSSPANSSTPALSDRELEIVRLVTQGLTNKQIAQIAHISENTVKVHLNNIYRKAEVQSRAELTMLAVRLGWVIVETNYNTPAADPSPETIVSSPPTPKPDAEPTTAVSPIADAPTPIVASNAEPMSSFAPTNAPVPPENLITQDTTSNPPIAAENSAPAPMIPAPLIVPQPRPQTSWQAKRLWSIGLVALLGFAALLYLVSNTQAWRELVSAGSPTNPATAAPNLTLPIQTPPPRWQARAPLPSAREAMASALLNNQIYLIGGLTNGNTLNEVQLFDPQLNTWSQRARKPTAVQGANAGVIGGRIYVPGGCDAENQPTSLVEVYDPAADSWQKGVPLPTKLCHYALSVYEGKLYLFGGWNGNEATNTAFSFSPEQGEWRELAALPSARANAGAAVVGDRIFIVGGRTSEANLLNELLMFNPAQGRDSTQAFTQKAPMKQTRAGMGVVSLASQLYVLGGGWAKAIPAAEQNAQYDVSADRWGSLEAMNEPVWRVGAAATLGTKVYVFGGSQGQTQSAAVQEFTALYQFFLPSAPTGR